MTFWGGGGGYPGFGWGGFQNFQNPMSMWTPSPWPIPTAHLSTSKSAPAPAPAQPPAQPSVGDDDSNSDYPERHHTRRHHRRRHHRSRSESSPQAVPERTRRPHANGEAVNDAAKYDAASESSSAFYGPTQPSGYPVCGMPFLAEAIVFSCHTFPRTKN